LLQRLPSLSCQCFIVCSCWLLLPAHGSEPFGVTLLSITSTHFQKILSHCTCRAKSPMCLQQNACATYNARTPCVQMLGRCAQSTRQGKSNISHLNRINTTYNSIVLCVTCHTRGCKYMLLRQVGRDKVATLKRVPTAKELSRFDTSDYPSARSEFNEQDWKAKASRRTSARIRDLVPRPSSVKNNLIDRIFRVSIQ